MRSHIGITDLRLKRLRKTIIPPENINIITDNKDNNKGNDIKLEKLRRVVVPLENIITEDTEGEDTEDTEDNKGTDPKAETTSTNSKDVIKLNKNVSNFKTIENGTSIHLMKGNTDFTVEILGKLGEGGFGVVYKCKSDTGEIYALKKILTRKRGVPCLMEASISNTYNHPYLNKSILVNATLDGIYILQDVAPCDLHAWRKANKPTESQISNILHKVCLGLSFLHKQDIVHGDIKPSNILYFNDDDIRLTDFNLTTYVKWKSDIHLCTSTYRPIELWANKEWSTKIDIWSLGCTFYELVFGKGLIPWQGDDKFVKKRYINCIVDWADFNSPTRKPKKYSITYHGPRIHASLKNGENKSGMINLLLRCLQVMPSDRPNIDTILADPFFYSNGKSQICITSPKLTIGSTLDKKFLDTIKNDLVNYVPATDPILLETAAKICAEYVKRECYSDPLVKKICVWIAKKLIRTDMKGQDIPNADKSYDEKKLLEMEIYICNKLLFKLH
jgi:cyclin-dependent kinase